LVSPPSGEIDDAGLIENDGDVDSFLFTTTTGGALNIAIDPVELGPSLDLVAELYDDTHSLLKSSIPADDLNATLTSTVAAGTFTIRISNTSKGDPLADGYTGYATLGEYTLACRPLVRVLSSDPDEIEFRHEIHVTSDGDNYGRVVRAFLIPPISGNYTFSHSSDHQGWTTLTPAEVTILTTTPVDAFHDLPTVEIPFPGSHCFLRLGVD
jgi:hypothetical protein